MDRPIAIYLKTSSVIVTSVVILSMVASIARPHWCHAHELSDSENGFVTHLGLFEECITSTTDPSNPADCRHLKGPELEVWRQCAQALGILAPIFSIGALVCLILVEYHRREYWLFFAMVATLDSLLCFLICTIVFLTNVGDSGSRDSGSGDSGSAVLVHWRGFSLYFGIVAMVLCVLNVGFMVWYKRAANITNQQFYPCIRHGYSNMDNEMGDHENIQRNNRDNRDEQGTATRCLGVESENPVDSNPALVFTLGASSLIGADPVGNITAGDNHAGDNPGKE